MKKNRFFYIIIAPAVILMAWLTIYPVIETAGLSFFRYNYISDTVRRFVGFGNFVQIIQEDIFRQAFKNTVLFSVAATLIEVGLGLVLALIFSGDFPGKKFTLTIVIFPMMISTMVICAVWGTFYHYEIGLLNTALRALGQAPVEWLINKHWALFSIILVDIWQWTPFAFILIQAAMTSIPREIYEAAEIDGARYHHTLGYITLPILSGQILLLVMLRTIDTFKLFGKVYALTQGGPGNATETLSYYIYREGFSYFNMGKASAASLLTLLTVIIISQVYLRKILRSN